MPSHTQHAHYPPDKRPGCGGIALMLGIMAVLSIALILVITHNDPARDANQRLVKSGPLAVNALRAGDCVHLDSRTEIDGLTALPCAEPHSAQVITTGSLPEGEYPGTTAIASMVDNRCAAAFDRALQGNLAYDVLTFAPTDLAWHDRGYSCLVVRTDGSDIIGDVALVTG